MRVAQRLYEGIDIGGDTVGLITYMRTDGVQIADEAIAAIRALLGKEYGKSYVPDAPRRYQTKAKNAQEAHEAIRPTDVSRRPRDVRGKLDADQAKLYELIWQRAVASQMESAEIERTTVDITAKVAARLLELRATGSVVKFDGFLKLYQEGRDDDPEDEDSRRLPAMSAGEPLTKKEIAATQHFTEPPPRYSEASLVKRMEELGIGRPSTYASILQVLKDRKYVRIDKRRLVPEDRGRIVVAFLESFFARYVEYDFTADLEEQLDRVSNNEVEWRQLLREFWIAIHRRRRRDQGPQDQPGHRRARRDAGAAHLSAARRRRRSAPLRDLRHRAPLAQARQVRRLHRLLELPGMQVHAAVLGARCRRCRGDRDAGARARPRRVEVTLRNGRFGPYVQLGEAVDGEKPKRASLLRGMDPADIDLETALKLLSLPREVGRHPEDGQPIVANAGRYGPYVQHGKTYANLDSGDDVFNIGLNRAVTLIAEKLAKGPRARFGGDPGRSLGDHPDKGGAVLVKKGRYGPYVTHDGINATLPSDKTPETITLEEALGLIAARAERTGGGKRAAGKGAKAKAGAEKAATAKSKKAKGKAKLADAADEAGEGVEAEESAAAPAKPKKPTSTARAKAAKKPAPTKRRQPSPPRTPPLSAPRPGSRLAARLTRPPPHAQKGDDSGWRGKVQLQALSSATLHAIGRDHPQARRWNRPRSSFRHGRNDCVSHRVCKIRPNDGDRPSRTSASFVSNGTLLPLSDGTSQPRRRVQSGFVALALTALSNAEVTAFSNWPNMRTKMPRSRMSRLASI